MRIKPVVKNVHTIFHPLLCEPSRSHHVQWVKQGWNSAVSSLFEVICRPQIHFFPMLFPSLMCSVLDFELLLGYVRMCPEVKAVLLSWMMLKLISFLNHQIFHTPWPVDAHVQANSFPPIYLPWIPFSAWFSCTLNVRSQTKELIPFKWNLESAKGRMGFYTALLLEHKQEK